MPNATTFANEIAIIELQNTLLKNMALRVNTLTTSSLTVAGWGLTQEDGKYSERVPCFGGDSNVGPY